MTHLHLHYSYSEKKATDEVFDLLSANPSCHTGDKNIPNISKTKMRDLIFRFPGFWREGICRVRIFLKENQKVAIISEVPMNHSTSVTNAIERIWEKLTEESYIDSNTVVIEHYEKEDCSLKDRDIFNIVEHDKEGRPTWKSTCEMEVKKICGIEDDELSSRIENNILLFKEILEIQQEVEPDLYRPKLEYETVIERRRNISEKMLSKKELHDFIKLQSKEAIFLKALKKDLSIFGEVYAELEDEYICFSEFPVGDGFVDYVVFTGRSRMDVILIEVKGADIFFANSNSYENRSAKVNEAIQQLEHRISVIEKDYENFRKFVHEVRKKVEAGECKYNAFLGPKFSLQVDPNKEIFIRGVVIRGRSRDDKKESSLRHSYERVSNRKIRLESWNSFLRKLKRN